MVKREPIGEYQKRIRQNSEKTSTTIRRLFSISEDAASNDEIRERLLSGGQIRGTNMVVMVSAMLIASVGLNTNSTAVIIGAMLISPLMGSILAVAYGTVAVDIDLAKRHLIGFIAQIILSILASSLYFLLSPIKEPTTELLARTSPTFYDVIVAIAGGVAGIVGQTRKDKANNIIPGVAIATALMPPLCTCGYAIANGEWRMLGGAAYLFLVNTYFIYGTACVVLSLFRIPKVKELTDKEWRRIRRGMWRNTILVLIPMVVLPIIMYNV